jgi:hypothetical protein
MIFGINVHTQGPSGLLKSTCQKISRELERKFSELVLSEVDGLFIGFLSTSVFEAGLKIYKRRIKRNYDMKLITLGTVEHYNCLVDMEVELPDALVIEANTDEAMRIYIKAVLLDIVPKLLKGQPDTDQKRVAQVFETI